MTDKKICNSHFVLSHDFHGDAEYVAWLQEVKTRYQRISSRIALQANYGALEFNWLLGRDLVEKKAEQKWGTGVVEQISLDLRAEYPDVKGFSSRNLWYMKQWYLFYQGDIAHTEKLHQLGAELQSAENQNPVKLHQLGAELVSTSRVATIIENGEMLPVFGIVPWRHHILIVSKCKSMDEAFFYLRRTIHARICRQVELLCLGRQPSVASTRRESHHRIAHLQVERPDKGGVGVRQHPESHGCRHL